MSTQSNPSGRRGRTADASTNGGTVLEIICVGIVSWLAYGLLLSLVLLLLGNQLKQHTSMTRSALVAIGYASWGLGIISLTLGGYMYGLKRQRALNPVSVLLGWIIYGSASSVFGFAVLRVAKPSAIQSWPIELLWAAVVVAACATATLFGAYRRKCPTTTPSPTK